MVTIFENKDNYFKLSTIGKLIYKIKEFHDPEIEIKVESYDNPFINIEPKKLFECETS